MIKRFVDYLQKSHQKTLDCYTRCLTQNIIDEFDKYYGFTLLITKEQTDYNRHERKKYDRRLQKNTRITWDDMVQYKKKFNKRFQKLINRLEQHSRIHEQKFVLRKIKEKYYPDYQNFCQKHIKEAKQEIWRKTICYEDAEKEFSHGPTHYLYLYAAIKVFCEYLKECENQKELAEYLDERALQIFKKMSEQRIDVVTVLSAYLSHHIEAKTIICLRTRKKGKTNGWYDSKKSMIYLPYESYYEDFVQYWNDNYRYAFPYTQNKLQQELVREKVLVVLESQTKGNYIRCQCRIVVDPPEGDLPSEQRPVLKVDIGKLALSPEAEQRLKEMSEIIVPRRRKSIK